MYSLQVYYSDAAVPRAVVSMARATQMTAQLERLFAEHGGCDRIVALVGTTFLFAVDGKGDPIVQTEVSAPDPQTAAH